MFPVFKTRIGNLGGLQCWEHRMPANLLIMNALNEQIHVASWPSCVPFDDHMFSIRADDNASEYYAITVGTFVLINTLVCTPEILRMLEEGNPDRVAAFTGGGGHGGVLNPRGTRITERLAPDQEGILYADIDLAEIIESKYLIDCAGHYSKGNVARLVYNQNPQNAVSFVGKQCEYAVPYEELSDYENE